MDSILDGYKLDLFKFFKRYFIAIIIFTIIGLLLGRFLDNNLNTTKVGINFRIYYTVDNKISQKYEYAYNLIHHLYTQDSTVTITPDRVNDVGNAVKLINYNFKSKLINELKDLFTDNKNKNLIFFANLHVNSDEHLEFEFEVSGDNNIYYPREKLIKFQNDLSDSINQYFFQEFMDYYNIYDKNSKISYRQILKNHELELIIQKFYELQKDIYNSPQSLDLYEYAGKFIRDEMRIDHSKNELSKTISEIKNKDILKQLRVGKIKEYSLRLLNVKFITTIPIVFMIISIAFFLFFDEYFKKRKN